MPTRPRQDPIVRIARALGDPTRLRILRGIAARGEVSCRELTALFRIAQATVSHHLKVLAEAGLVSVRVEEPFHFYRAHPEALAAHGRALAAALAGKPQRRSRPRHVPHRSRPHRKSPHRKKESRT